jgi:hypothetical protein
MHNARPAPNALPTQPMQNERSCVVGNADDDTKISAKPVISTAGKTCRLPMAKLISLVHTGSQVGILFMRWSAPTCQTGAKFLFDRLYPFRVRSTPKWVQRVSSRIHSSDARAVDLPTTPVYGCGTSIHLAVGAAPRSSR